jgi:hypothetical protein
MSILRSVSALLTLTSCAALLSACSSSDGSSHPYLHVDNHQASQVKFVWGPSQNDTTPWNTFVDGTSPGNGPGKQTLIDAQGSAKLALPPAGHYRWGALEYLPLPSDPTSVGYQLVQEASFDSNGSTDQTVVISGQSSGPAQATCDKLSVSPTFTCSDPSFVACGNDRCCSPAKPYWCGSQCYATAADVNAAGCSTECLACGNAPATSSSGPGTDGGTSGGLKANGSVCLLPSDCVSGKCVNDLCACDDAGHSQCPCLPSGSGCTDNDSACCSLSCGFNVNGACD